MKFYSRYQNTPFIKSIMNQYCQKRRREMGNTPPYSFFLLHGSLSRSWVIYLRQQHGELGKEQYECKDGINKRQHFCLMQLMLPPCYFHSLAIDPFSIKSLISG